MAAYNDTHKHIFHCGIHYLHVKIQLQTLYCYTQHGLIAALIFTVTYDTEANSRMRTKMLNWLIRVPA